MLTLMKYYLGTPYEVSPFDGSLMASANCGSECRILRRRTRTQPSPRDVSQRLELKPLAGRAQNVTYFATVCAIQTIPPPSTAIYQQTSPLTLILDVLQSPPCFAPSRTPSTMSLVSPVFTPGHMRASVWLPDNQ